MAATGEGEKGAEQGSDRRRGRGCGVWGEGGRGGAGQGREGGEYL